MSSLPAGSDEKLARAQELGATHTINYRTTPKWHDRVLELTGGTGVDLVVENGGAGTLNQSMLACRAGGTIALLGAPHRPERRGEHRPDSDEAADDWRHLRRFARVV